MRQIDRQDMMRVPVREYVLDPNTGLMKPTKRMEAVVSEPVSGANKVEVVNPNPNGTPVIPPAIVPWLTVLAVLAGVIASGPALGLTFIPPAVAGVAGAVVAVLTALGIASPGMRKPGQ